MHEERMKLFRFIWEYFRAKDPEGMKKALFWLQVRMSSSKNNCVHFMNIRAYE